MLAKRPPWLKAAGYAAGLALLLAAVWTAATQDGDRVLETLQTTHPGWIALQGLLAIASAALIAASFWVVSTAYGKVGLDEMFGLVGLAWLLNYLPMRPGLLGRVAYHKRYNNIAVKDSVRVLAINAVTTLACSAHVGLLGLTFLFANTPIALAAVAILPLAVIAVLVHRLANKGPLKAVDPWRIWATILLHYADLTAWAARYALAASILGHDLSLPQAATLAALSQFAFLVPFAGNGLGVREWSLGLAGAAGLAGQASGLDAISSGVELELINRAGELLAALPVGFLGLWYVIRMKRIHERQSRNTPDPTDAPSVQNTDGAPTNGAHNTGGGHGQQDRAGPPEVPPDRPGQDP